MPVMYTVMKLHRMYNTDVWQKILDVAFLKKKYSYSEKFKSQRFKITGLICKNSMKYTISNVFLSNVCREFQDIIENSKSAFNYVVVANVRERKTHEHREMRKTIYQLVVISPHFTEFLVYYLKFILIWKCCKCPDYSYVIYVMSTLCCIFSHGEMLKI